MAIMRMRRFGVTGASATAVALAVALGGRAQAVGCGGDCNGDGQVTINELLLGVNIALGSRPVADCSSVDGDGDGHVQIGELIQAVNHALTGCPASACTAPPANRCVEIAPGPSAQDDLLSALIEAEPGDDILIKAGTYELGQRLSLTVDNVTVHGEGIDQTVLHFADIGAGGQNLLVSNVRNFTLRDLTIRDGGKVDLFKAAGVTGLRVQRVRTEWTSGASPDNGGYGIYPVQCTNVLIEDSIARGASDTGIYVGQSQNIIVRRNLAELNVDGIEIENSTDADVYQNTAQHNAAGIAVFNLPGLSVYGQRTRVHDNQIAANNTTNFAPQGNIVSLAPTGTGMLILANDKVEVFGNTFQDNNTSHVVVISYNSAHALAGVAPSGDPNYDPYSESIFIHDNTYVGGGTAPANNVMFLVNLIMAKLGEGLPLPQIVVDNDVDPAKLVDGMLPANLRTCIQDPSATFINLNVPLLATVPNITHDRAPFDCTLEPLPAVVIPGVE
jgi:parallel beta-helix repeat protein